MNKILIIGLGLIGGSIARTIKSQKLDYEVFAIDQNQDSIDAAKSSNVIFEGSTEKSFIHSKDFHLIIISTPISAFFEYADLVSRTQSIVAMTSSSFDAVCRFVESSSENDSFKQSLVFSHPIAGSEKSGFENSTSNIFEEKIIAIAGYEDSRKNQREVINFWKELNSIPKELTMQQHEQVLMLTSHLPHVLAFIMIKVLFEKSSDEGTKNLTKSLKDFSGGGLKEFLRLASSDSQVWTDIIISNKKELKKGIEIFESELENFKKLLTNIEKEEVLEILENVKDFVDSNWT